MSGPNGSQEPFEKVHKVATKHTPKVGLAAMGLYTCFVQYRNTNTGQCNPSIEKLAEDTGASEPTIKRHIAALKRAGLITVHRPNKQQGNFYTFPCFDGSRVIPQSIPDSSPVIPQKRSDGSPAIPPRDHP
jgi:biotin operon repressor